MANEEVEYEVESIVEAKVEKVPRARSKNPKLVWKYRVRWKGYTPDEDTWEPIDSFDGSEHIVIAFWERAGTGGRNIEDMEQFKLGETFRPLGPPRKKRKRKRTGQEEVISVPEAQGQTSQHPTSSEKRPRDSAERDGSVPPSKRLREENPEPIPLQSSPSITYAARPQGRRQQSLEVIPDSDEELDRVDRLKTLLSPNYRDAKDSDKARQEELPDNDGDDDVPETFDPLFDEPTKKVPEHINRKENPLVKLVDAPNLDFQGAISAKVRAIRDVNPSSSSQLPSNATQRARPGPGRSSTGLALKHNMKSSLLTAEKGAMKTIKGKYKKEATSTTTIGQELQASGRSGSPILVDEDLLDDNAPKVVPSAEELLQMAGLDGAAVDLPEFDEVREKDEKGEKETQVDPTTNVGEPSSSASDEAQKSLQSKSGTEFPQHNLFSQFIPTTSFEKLETTFKRSTIFGPLSLGLDSTSKSQHPESPRIFLNLDSSVSIPALLVNVTIPVSDIILMLGHKGAPGKFYDETAALTLMGALRAGGLSAGVIVDENATEEEKQHFKHFCARLQIGDIFVAVAGIHILVLCSSNNTLLSQRLNIPPTLQNTPNGILVSQVEVENYSGYADATSNADERRWVQYIATVS